jgi:hypothetical protein
MDNYEGHVNILWSVSSIIFAVISLANMQEWVGLVAGFMAIGSGFMAIRYYYFRTKNK